MRRSAWEHNGENWGFYSHREWTHSSNCTFLSSGKYVATSYWITGHNRGSPSILHSSTHRNTCKQPGVKINLGCVCTGTVGLEFSPGGVHASTEDWTNTDRLLEGIGIFLSLYFAKAAWTASVCKSKRTHRHRLAKSKEWEHKLFKTGSVDTWLPDLKRSSRVLGARDLLCLEPGWTAWEEAWILLSICSEGSTPAERKVRDRRVYEKNKIKRNAQMQKYQSQKYEKCLDIEEHGWKLLNQIKYPKA